LGLTPAALGCAQLAGLTDDYYLAAAGTGAIAGLHSGGTAGEVAHGGSSGANENDEAGAAGETTTGGNVGTTESGGAAAGGKPGASGAGGSLSGAGSNSAGSAGSSGGTANSAGSSGSAGSSPGPTRIGISQFHDSAFGNDNASSHLTNATFTKPANTIAGDLMLVFFGADHSLANLDGNTLSGLGWELLDQHSDYGTDGQGSYLLYKFATGNEPNQIVFNGINSPNSGNGVQGLLSVYRGVNTMQPFNAYEYIVVKTGMDGLHFVNATPAITTTEPNCLLIAGFSPDTTIDRPIIDSWPASFTENQTSVLNAPNPYPLGWANIFTAERSQPSPGNVAASSFNWTVTNDTEGGRYFGFFTFVAALAPAN